MNQNPPDESSTINDSSSGGSNRQGSWKELRGGLTSARIKSIKYCALSEIPVIGDSISWKRENTVRMYFENLNSICSHKKGVDKGKYFSTLLDKLEIDCFGAVETNLQWKMMRTSPRKVLDLSHDTKTTYACNDNEQTIKKQQGGTCVTIMERYGQYVENTGKDGTGLGRWSWMKIKGNNGLTTTIIAAYLPCIARKCSLLSIYAQQTRYWR